MCNSLRPNRSITLLGTWLSLFGLVSVISVRAQTPKVHLEHITVAATISDTVNTASRIESLTKHYGVSILKLQSREQFDVGLAHFFTKEFVKAAACFNPIIIPFHLSTYIHKPIHSHVKFYP